MSNVPSHPPQRLVMDMLRRALKAALATRDRHTGAPHASLVQVATAVDGRPVILVSDLAVHARNLAADPSASLLIDESDASGDPATGARVTFSGRFASEIAEDARPRYLARHPGAAAFADFGDFRFLTLEVKQAHLIQGFGRIVTLPGTGLILDRAALGADGMAWVRAAQELKSFQGDVAGLDPDGVDLVTPEGGKRFGFEVRARDAAEAAEFVRTLPKSR